MKITVAHKGTQHPLDIEPEASVADLQDRIFELTSVPRANQKLLAKPAKGVVLSAKQSEEASLLSAGLKEGHHIMVLGATAVDVANVRQAEEEATKWAKPRNYHPSLLQGSKPRTTASAKSAPPFQSIAPHRSLPSSSPLYPQVVSYLQRLANDEGIIHVCRLHDYTVGHLTELLPWESPELLGLNENKGQTIRLRIRTDDAQGFRDYKTTRAVLIHELAHIDVSDHPPEFKILNSKLNAELAAFERNAAAGTHTLHGGEMYVPSDVPATTGHAPQGGAYVLGGGQQGLGSDARSSEERRQAVLQATLSRLERLENEIEVGCGSGRNPGVQKQEEAPR